VLEDYDKSYFPFTFFRWSPRLTGFWGDSLANRLTGNQIEIKCTCSAPACWVAIVQVMMCLEDAKREFIQ
jgi:hypothetical protein